MKHKYLCLVLVILSAYRAHAAIGNSAEISKLPTCAILNIKEGHGIDKGVSGQLSARLTVAAEHSGQYTIIPRLEVSRILSQHQQVIATPENMNDAIKTARLLKADFVIFGKVWQDGLAHYLETYLVDVNNAKHMGGTRTKVSGYTGEFFTKAPVSNIRTLLKIQHIEDPITPEVAIKEANPAPALQPQATNAIAQVAEQSAIQPVQTAGPAIDSELTDLQSRLVDKEDGLKTAVSTNAVVAPVVVAPATEQVTVEPPDNPPVLISKEPDVNNKMENIRIGTGFSLQMLLKDSKNTFFGSIDKLEVQNNAIPLNLFVEWLINEQWSLSTAWNHMQVKTITTVDGKTDGDFLLDGPSLTAIYHFKHAGLLRYHAGGGLIYYMTEFDESTWWGGGFDSPEQWIEMGQPDKMPNGYERHMDLSNTIGLRAMGGATYEINKNWFAGADAELNLVEVKDDFYSTIDGEFYLDLLNETVPLNHLAVKIYAGYDF